MADVFAFINTLKGFFPFLEVIVIVLIFIFILNYSLVILKRSLLAKATSKQQVSNIKILTRIVNIFLILLVVIFVSLSYLKSWTGISVIFGLLTAAIGFALQKPITGIAAWIMVVVKRPFQIGDRVTIGKVKGDIYDISLTHLYIDEVGGTIDAEQHSGRHVMVPNHLLFEEVIINHTLKDDYVLGEVTFDLSYDSDLDKAMNLALDVANKYCKKYAFAINRENKVRLVMGSSGFLVRLLFYAPIQEITQIKTDIIKDIFYIVNKQKDISLAYPHQEIIVKDKKKNPYKKRKK